MIEARAGKPTKKRSQLKLLQLGIEKVINPFPSLWDLQATHSTGVAKAFPQASLWPCLHAWHVQAHEVVWWQWRCINLRAYGCEVGRILGQCSLKWNRFKSRNGVVENSGFQFHSWYQLHYGACKLSGVSPQFDEETAGVDNIMFFMCIYIYSIYIYSIKTKNIYIYITIYLYILFIYIYSIYVIVLMLYTSKPFQIKTPTIAAWGLRTFQSFGSTKGHFPLAILVSPAQTFASPSPFKTATVKLANRLAVRE